MEEKIYTQEDVDAIVDKVKARLEKELSSVKELNTNLAKSNEELLAYKDKFADVSLKSEFVKRGGNEAAWDDFKALNGGLLELSSEELDKELESIKQSKPYYFNGVEQNSVKLDYNGELKDLFGDADNSLIEGTIYRANQKF